MSMVRYDAEARVVEIQLEDHAIRVDRVDEPRFVRLVAGTATQAPLWVSTSEADVLVKMIEYILGKVKITSSSREALESVLPRVREAGTVVADAAPAEAPAS